MNLTFLILGCVVPGLMTGVGAIPIFFAKDVSQKGLDILLAAAAGVMLAATCFSLVIPSLEIANGTMGVVSTGLGIFFWGSPSWFNRQVCAPRALNRQ